jgi:hypothetical protein
MRAVERDRRFDAMDSVAEAAKQILGKVGAGLASNAGYDASLKIGRLWTVPTAAHYCMHGLSEQF